VVVVVVVVVEVRVGQNKREFSFFEIIVATVPILKF
jgi:hypothetical protein